MKTPWLLRWVIPALLFGSIAFLLMRNQALVGTVLANKSQVALLFGLFTTFIVGPVWIGYVRLNSLDPADGLRSIQAQNIRKFGFETKKRLVRFFLYCGLLVVSALVAALLAGTYENYKIYVVPLVLSAMATFFIFAITRIVNMLILIEATIGNVAQWRLEQRERSKQIEQLKKGRVESKIVLDEGLLRYRAVGYTAEAIEAGASTGLNEPAPAKTTPDEFQANGPA